MIRTVPVDLQCWVRWRTLEKVCYYWENLLSKVDCHMQVYMRQWRFLMFSLYVSPSCTNRRNLSRGRGLGYFQWFGKYFQDGVAILVRVYFTEEVWFHIGGCSNKQNSRIWSTEFPCILHEQPWYSLNVGMWCGISCRRVIDSLFFLVKL